MRHFLVLCVFCYAVTTASALNLRSHLLGSMREQIMGKLSLSGSSSKYLGPLVDNYNREVDMVIPSEADLIYFPIKTLDECADECSSRPECVAFAYGKVGSTENKCSLKKAGFASISNPTYNVYRKKVKGYNTEKNSAISGADIGYYPKLTLAQCAEKCDGNPECSAFNLGKLESNYGKCNLKRDGVAAGKNKSYNLYRKKMKGYVRRPETDISGGDIGYLPLATLAECAAACNANPNCASFCFGILPTNYGKCNLKKAGLPTRDNPAYNYYRKL